MKKMKFLILIVTLLFLATGCDKPVMFAEYHPNNNQVIKNGHAALSFKVTFNKDVFSKENGKFWYTVTGPAADINWRTTRDSSAANPQRSCTKLDVDDTNVIYVVANLAKNLEVGQTLKYTVNVWQGTYCEDQFAYPDTKLYGTYETNPYTVISNKYENSSNTSVQSVPSTNNNLINGIITLIGGENEYCNTDMNGNLNILNESNLFVNVAYSQVGYKEKATNKSTATCTENIGDKNYQKYGNNGQAWSTHFVHWVLDKAKIKNSIPTSMSEMVNWANKNGRWTTDKNNMNSGDLVVLSTGSGTSGLTVGILYKENNNWYTILGNWNNGVESKLLDDVTKNATFYGVIKLKGITY